MRLARLIIALAGFCTSIIKKVVITFHGRQKPVNTIIKRANLIFHYLFTEVNYL